VLEAAKQLPPKARKSGEFCIFSRLFGSLLNVIASQPMHELSVVAAVAAYLQLYPRQHLAAPLDSLRCCDGVFVPQLASVRAAQ